MSDGAVLFFAMCGLLLFVCWWWLAARLVTRGILPPLVACFLSGWGVILALSVQRHWDYWRAGKDIKRVPDEGPPASRPDSD